MLRSPLAGRIIGIPEQAARDITFTNCNFQSTMGFLVPDAKGEDNWRYVNEDYAKLPPKPTLDGEPSYENIPQG